MTADRTRLAAEQAALLGALLGQQQCPPGFDPEQMRIQQTALIAKRRRLIARVRRDLSHRLGERFTPLFNAYAAVHPRRAGQTVRMDVRAFTRWLSRHGELRRRWRRR